MIELFEKMGRMIENGGRDSADIRRHKKDTTESQTSSAKASMKKDPQQDSTASIVTLAEQASGI